MPWWWHDGSCRLVIPVWQLCCAVAGGVERRRRGTGNAGEVMAVGRRIMRFGEWNSFVPLVGHVERDT